MLMKRHSFVHISQRSRNTDWTQWKLLPGRNPLLVSDHIKYMNNKKMHNVPEEALYEENIRSNRSIKVMFQLCTTWNADSLNAFWSHHTYTSLIEFFEIENHKRVIAIHFRLLEVLSCFCLEINTVVRKTTGLVLSFWSWLSYNIIILYPHHESTMIYPGIMLWSLFTFSG